MGITTAGLAIVADLVVGDGSPAAFDYLALGTSATAFSVGQTALIAETAVSGLARMVADTVSSSGAVGTLVAEWTAAGSATIREIGVFNDASAGTMLMRALLPTPRAMTTGATYTATVNFTIAAA